MIESMTDWRREEGVFADGNHLDGPILYEDNSEDANNYDEDGGDYRSKQRFFNNYSGRDRRPVVCVAAPDVLRDFLYWTKWVGKNGELAIMAVDYQLNTYEENTNLLKVTPVTSLFEASAQKIGVLLEEDPENLETVSNLIDPVLARAIWRWEAVPYLLLCSVLSRFHSEATNHNDEEHDIDLWILRNERWIRQTSRKPDANWTTGLITLDMGNIVFRKSVLEANFRRITREDMSGFKFLDLKRSSSIHIQPNDDSFHKMFKGLTGGQLEGLDWSNVFVAGGIVLGSVLCTDGEQVIHKPEQWKGSDVDIYIYGLDPPKSVEKIRHLFKIFKQNLPENTPTMVVRNSKTISFISEYPYRRFQIILKLVKNPAEVLLNFDLDICAMGFDGSHLYMLPRAARALESGYNVFTMEMIQGSYLADRRASQEQRVFKYANKGYGIRILPKYLDALKTIDMASLLPEARYSDAASSSEDFRSINFDLDIKVLKARDYFEEILKVYLAWSDDGRGLSRSYTDGWKGTTKKPDTTLPVFTHALIDTRNQTTSEPLGRSCLTGFELLYRHVALWEAEQQGRLYIQDDVWASTTYEEVLYGISYEELPKYSWDETFSQAGFTHSIKNFNLKQVHELGESLDQRFVTIPWFDSLPMDKLDKGLSQLKIQRIVSGDTAEEVLTQESDLSIPLWLPPDFVDFAKGLISAALRDNNLPNEEVLEVVLGRIKRWSPASLDDDYQELLVLVLFKISTNLMWQQIDRRIDEVFELLWSFMHCNSTLVAPDADRTLLLMRQLSRRSVRHKPDDEFKDFASWVRRNPGSIGGEHYGAMGQGFWWEVLGEEEED